MYKVKVKNVCACFIKRGLNDNQEFDTQEESKKVAEALLETMQTTFCARHTFSMKEFFGDYTIETK